jgi:Flp pilus assembly secretin CpaC
VPILGDIPVLGIAFRRTTRDDVKRELLIFLTPTIVNSPASLRRVTEDERNRAELVDKAFTDKELANYFEPPPLFPDAPLPDDGKEIRRAVLVEKTKTTKTTTTAAPVKTAPAKRSP